MTERDTCPACGRLKRLASGCAFGQVVEGRWRVAFGYEHPDCGVAVAPSCEECNVVTGQFHHWGCPNARCRACGHLEHEGACASAD